MRITTFAMLAALAGALVFAAGAPAQPAPGFTELISLSTAGVQGDQDSELPSISSDGRFVAFASFAENLVPDDTNMVADIFVRDRLLGTTERVSVSSGGRQADGHSGVLNLMGGPSISGDGRFVAFSSDATNLVSGDRNANPDVFVHDRVTGETTRVSVASDGSEANAGGSEPSLSRDGRFVAFVSSADNLVPDGNFTGDIYLHDRQAGTTERISEAPDGSDANSQSFAPNLNQDGRFVYFTSFASNLIAGDQDDSAVDAYLFDRQTGTMEGITSVPQSETVHHSQAGGISGDGRFVTFSTQDTGFVTPDTNGAFDDAWLVDRSTGEYILVGVNDAGAQADRGSFAGDVSDDGRFVVMTSQADNLGGGTTNLGRTDVFVRDVVAGTTRIVSVATDGTESDLDSGAPAMTPDGQVIAFSSRASTFVPENQSFFANDIFVRDARAQADLSVTKTDSPDPVVARSNLTYTVTVTNDGPATATGVTLVDRLPDAVFVSATSSQGTCVRQGKGRRDGDLVCDLGTLAPGASATVTIVVTPSRDGTITNTATVRANEPDADRADNTATETTTVVAR
jgi:uncharacterized repeat protein (TIGR01451 family)